MTERITEISKNDEIIHLVFEKTKMFHKYLCALISDLKFPSSEIKKADRIFSETKDEYIILKKDTTKLHLFVTANNIHFVIDSPESEGILEKIRSEVDFLK